MTKIGFIGLGNMGSAAARNLPRAGFALTMPDLRPEGVAPWEVKHPAERSEAA
ncbi:MAG: NAD(P)-dependent oxidoreductase [Caldilinea sp. CFX5]|nr:NAD(P)-dependent oxidoreductase [Caldilinea sp. CFX5]